MKIKLSFLALLTLVISCKTYTIAPENFKKQIIEGNSNDTKEVKINNPLSLYSNIQYQANSLKYLNVIDKNGSPSSLQNSPSVEMRVTLKNGKRKIFYLDTVILENDTLKGNKSRFLGLNNQIPFDQIIKIEVQDGGKNYHYVPPTKQEIIYEDSHKIFANRGEVLQHFDFKIDTISIRADKFNNFYFASCKFEKSQSELTFLYYLNNDILELITTREISPYENDIWWINQFYLNNNDIFFEEAYCLPKAGNKIPKTGKYKDYKFDKNFSTSFLKKISFEIYKNLQK